MTSRSTTSTSFREQKAVLVTGLLASAFLATDGLAQSVERVSLSSSGVQGNALSSDALISSDGRYVVFSSDGTNLVAGDTNAFRDVFLRDRDSGLTTRLSVSTGGAQGNALSSVSDPSPISANGRYVVFYSSADNLVAGDTNGLRDVFLRDTIANTTVLVSVSTGGVQGDGLSSGPTISADGRYVAFYSSATNLVLGDANGSRDCFVRDVVGGTTIRVSVATGGAEGDGSSSGPTISADGHFVTFYSSATNLVAGDTNAFRDVFVRDLLAGTTTLVSISSGGVQGDKLSSEPTISSDGRYVCFYSDSTNLVTGDTNAVRDVFVRDRTLNATTRVSLSSSGGEGNARSETAAISGDGLWVVFDSDATNLVTGDTNLVRDTFLRDRTAGTTIRVNASANGAQGNAGSADGSLSFDGRYVAFGSNASNLVLGDTNAVEDVFVLDQAGIGVKYCTANSNSTGAPADLSAAGSASVSAGNLSLTAAPVPNQNGIFFHGVNQTQTPFGNGFMCTAGGIVRGSVIAAAGNVASYAYDNSDSKHSMAGYVGNTRNFQYWFRDPMGGGAFFNTSNAMAIPIHP